MQPVGWLRQHLSSRHAAASAVWRWGDIAGHSSPLAACCRMALPHADIFSSVAFLARLPPFAKHMVSLSSFFTGNRDSRGINCFYLFVSERLCTRKKVQK